MYLDHMCLVTVSCPLLVLFVFPSAKLENQPGTQNNEWMETVQFTCSVQLWLAIKMNETMSVEKNIDRIENHMRWNKPCSKKYYMFSLIYRTQSNQIFLYFWHYIWLQHCLHSLPSPSSSYVTQSLLWLKFMAHFPLIVDTYMCGGFLHT